MLESAAMKTARRLLAAVPVALALVLAYQVAEAVRRRLLKVVLARNEPAPERKAEPPAPEDKLTGPAGPRYNERLGPWSGGVTPVPIPNTAVKPASAEDTRDVGPWENRSGPG